MPSRSAVHEDWPARPDDFDAIPLLRDSLGRRYTYLRLSVTDRCDLACEYCMPPSGEEDHAVRRELLTFEEAARVASVFASRWDSQSAVHGWRALGPQRHRALGRARVPAHRGRATRHDHQRDAAFRAGAPAARCGASWSERIDRHARRRPLHCKSRVAVTWVACWLGFMPPSR